MDGDRRSDLFDEVLCGDAAAAADAIAGLPPEERSVVVNALRYVELEAEACAGRGSAVRAVFDRCAVA